MGDPDKEERDKCRVSEEGLNLLEVECFGFHSWCLVREIRKDGFTLGLGKELDSLRVYSVLTWIGLRLVGWLSYSWAGRSRCIFRKE